MTDSSVPSEWTPTAEEVAALDAAYEPIPTFMEWAASVTLDREHLDMALLALDLARDDAGPDLSDSAITYLMRAAAWDSGALEGLYRTDRGITLNVARGQAGWVEAAELASGADAIGFFEAQLNAYRLVREQARASEDRPVTEAWIRELHEVACESQATYVAYTDHGRKNLPLKRGAWKDQPNHVRRADGSSFSYAPVADVPVEMGRLVGELRSDEYLAADPLVQAAYSHYAFVRIHPFQDGNGRVARVLASLPLLAHCDIPLVIFTDDHDRYLDALEDADRGDVQRFVTFLRARLQDAIGILQEELASRGARKPTEESLTRLRGLFRVTESISIIDMDNLGRALHQHATNVLQEMINSYGASPEVTFQPQQWGGGGPSGPMANPDGWRNPFGQQQAFGVVIRSSPPANRQVTWYGRVLVAVDGKVSQPFLIESGDGLKLMARLDEVHPETTAAFQFRLRTWLDAGMGTVLEALAEATAVSLREQGYA